MAYLSLEEIVQRCGNEGIPFWKAVQYSDMEDREVTKEESFRMMEKMWRAMKEAGESYDKNQRSRSGLVGGMGGQMREYLEKGNSLSGSFISEVIAQALEMGEANACMHRIVAAPTAGACGVLPAVLLPIYKRQMASDTEITEAKYTAAGIGQVIASRAFIAGAAGGGRGGGAPNRGGPRRPPGPAAQRLGPDGGRPPGRGAAAHRRSRPGRGTGHPAVRAQPGAADH